MFVLSEDIYARRFLTPVISNGDMITKQVEADNRPATSV